MSAQIVVVGSANLDIVVPVPRHPAPGETVLGGDHERIPGGKGANQAVAGARLGGRVSFVGCIGADAAGAELRQSLESAGVNIDALDETTEAPSGIALITVDNEGENSIVVSPGANHKLSAEDIEREERIATADVVQLQLEIPLETNIAAAQKAQGLVILDPAPAPSDGLPAALLSQVDVLAPNETELALLAGRDVDPMNVDDVADAARSLGVETVVVSLGEHGAVVVAEEVTPVSSPVVEPVDSTGAGDAFRAALAVAIAEGDSLVEATRRAVRVGAATTLRFGAQPSLPTAEEVERLLP